MAKAKKKYAAWPKSYAIPESGDWCYNEFVKADGANAVYIVSRYANYGDWKKNCRSLGRYNHTVRRSTALREFAISKAAESWLSRLAVGTVFHYFFDGDVNAARCVVQSIAANGKSMRVVVLGFTRVRKVLPNVRFYWQHSGEPIADKVLEAHVEGKSLKLHLDGLLDLVVEVVEPHNAAKIRKNPVRVYGEYPPRTPTERLLLESTRLSQLGYEVYQQIGRFDTAIKPGFEDRLLICRRVLRMLKEDAPAHVEYLQKYIEKHDAKLARAQNKKGVQVATKKINAKTKRSK